MGEWLGGGGWVYSVQHPAPGREEWQGLFPVESDVLAERAAEAHNNLRAERDDWRRMYETEKAALESVALRADQLAKEHAGLRGQNARAFDTIAAQLARITELEAESAELRCDDALNVALDRIAELEAELQRAIILSELGDGEKIEVKP